MNLSRQLMGDMRSVTLKTLIRQSPAVKRSVCKFCNTVQIEGDTCHSWVENASKGGQKPWADVLVICCSTCQNAKRYPVDCPRQRRVHIRESSTATPMIVETTSKDKGGQDTDSQTLQKT